MNELILDGCAPFPLASYLKALGLLRLVAEQVDPQARGAWDRERFLAPGRRRAGPLPPARLPPHPGAESLERRQRVQ